MNIDWSEKRPTEPGMYLYSTTDWPYHLKTVKKGNWQQSQNPDELYANDDLLSTVEGVWLGPIPEYKKVNE